MIKSLTTLGVLAVTGILSLCDLCGPPVGAATGSPASTRAAFAAYVPPAVPPQVTAQPEGAIRTVRLAVQGMTCGGCVIGTRTPLTRLPGVTKADVRYRDKKGTAVVTYDPGKVTVVQMVAAVKSLGYTATTLQ